MSGLVDRGEAWGAGGVKLVAQSRTARPKGFVYVAVEEDSVHPIIPKMEPTIQTSDFRRNFGRYQTRAQTEAIAVASNGKIIGYFIGRAEYQAFRQYRDESGRSYAVDPPTQKGAVVIPKPRPSS